MDFPTLAEQLKKDKCVLDVVVCDDYVEATIRSKIKYYDEQMADWILKNTTRPEWVKDILRNLSKYEQEHRFRVTKDNIALILHEPVNAFGSPFVDLGYHRLDMLNAIYKCDYDSLAYLMVVETQSIRVEDHVLMDHFYRFARDCGLGLNN